MMGAVETEATAHADASADVGARPSMSAGVSKSAGVWSEPIVRADLLGTGAFAVSATVAAVVFTGPTRVAGVVVALTLFAVGVFTFLWSYITAVNRSRTDNIAVAQLYFLVSDSAPKRVRRAMMSALACQVTVAFATAIARSRTDGRAGSTLAFGILVPMFGLGLNGLWCSKHGSFSARQASAAPDPIVVGVPPSDDEMEQNSRHG